MTATDTFWTPDRIDRLLALRRSGHSLSQIAAGLGDHCNRSMVAGKLKRLGEFTGNGRGGHARRIAVDSETRATVIRMAGEGASLVAIAAALGVHKKTASRLVSKFVGVRPPRPQPAFKKKASVFGWRPKAPPPHPDRMRPPPRPPTGLAATEQKFFTVDCAPDTSVTLMAARHCHCRWPFGDGAGFRFCGAAADVEAGRPYCDRHDALAHGRPDPTDHFRDVTNMIDLPKFPDCTEVEVREAAE